MSNHGNETTNIFVVKQTVCMDNISDQCASIFVVVSLCVQMCLWLVCVCVCCVPVSMFWVLCKYVSKCDVMKHVGLGV